MYVNDDGNAGNGKDSKGNSDGNGNSNGDGDGDDAAPATDGKDVDEDDHGNLRTKIGRWQLDDNNRTTAMR
jgi:hypothetical protein